MIIKNKKITPYYQPIINASNGHIYGCEVLMRGIERGKKITLPLDIIPYIEHHNLMVPTMRDMLSQVIHDISPVLEKYHNPFYISVNINVTISILSLISGELIHFQESTPDNIFLVLELLESEDIDSLPMTKRILCRLRSAGIYIALDDFGVGYSNLNRLQELPVDILKIDRCFVIDLTTDNKGKPFIVDEIISIAAHRGIKVLAEGVETTFQRDYLLGKGVHLQQGYFWSPPVPVDKFKNYLNCHKYQ